MRGELLAERFRIERRLGSGAMGEVWAAQDERMRRDVAVKLVHAPFEAREAETQARFRREVQLAGRLSHQNIVTVHDWGEVHVGGRPVFYLVMELVPGRSLGKRLNEGTPAWPLAVGWAAQIARALDAAHREAILHRDIKPANVLLTPDGTAKVLDFGVAKFMGETMTVHDLTATGTLLGSPPYMSPEQAQGAREIDHRSDLYSLGCLLYHAVTGRPPFLSDSPWAILRMQMDDAPVAPSALVDGLPEPLSDLVLSLLAKRPEDRPADAAAVHDALSTLLMEQSVALGGPGILEAAELGHIDPVAGRILGKAWELWQRTQAGADEVLRTARADATALRDEALARIETDRRIARALGKEAEEKAATAKAAADEAERMRDRAQGEARLLREQAETEAQRVRAEALADAERIRAEAARNVPQSAPSPMPSIPPNSPNSPMEDSAAASMSPAAAVIATKLSLAREADGNAADRQPLAVPRFKVVRDGYDRKQVDDFLGKSVPGHNNVRTGITDLERQQTDTVRLWLRVQGRPEEDAERVAAELIASSLRQAEQDHAALGDQLISQGPDGSPMLFPLARRGYDRTQVDEFIGALEAEQARLQVRQNALSHVTKYVAGQIRAQ